MAALIRIPAADVHLDGLDIEYRLEPDWLDRLLVDGGASSRGAGRLGGRLSRSGNDIVVRCRVVAEVELPCVRCLEPAGVAVDAELSLLLEPRAESRSRRTEPEHELRPGEADLDIYDGETVVLDAFVREAILLEVPNFPLCSEDCPGIRPGPEVGSGEQAPPPALDPRLAPLGAFRDSQGARGDRTEGTATIDQLVAAAAARSAALGRKPILRSDSRRGVGKKKKKK